VSLFYNFRLDIKSPLRLKIAGIRKYDYNLWRNIKLVYNFRLDTKAPFRLNIADSMTIDALKTKGQRRKR
jgi:hypothetical protein